jgi:lipopolysaccharide biosynthesis protein
VVVAVEFEVAHASRNGDNHEPIAQLSETESKAGAIESASPAAAISALDLAAENERLTQRVEDLEQIVAEYRIQVSKVLNSSSWKLTSPIRATATRARTAKIKARRAARKFKNRGNSDGNHKLLTAGLFAPPLESLPEGSPLRGQLDVNTLRRPPEADGPLHRPEGDPKIAVVAHVHYPELWGDIEDRLSRMPEAYDLLVTVTEGHAEAAISLIRRTHPDAHIEVVPNRGRDWAPLVRLLNKGLLSGYDAVAKVHTKKSEHRVDGDGWRLALLDGVFESPERIRTIIDLLNEDRSVGLVVPTGHVVGPEHWGSNQGIVEMLAYRLPMAFDPDELAFPGGSMFWCRPWLLERISDLDINIDHFEPEAGHYDATTAHALERLVGIYSQVGGMDIVEVMDVNSRLKEYRKNPVTKPKIYAFYLPQYHQIPENDEFWGEGFTDWVNVKKAKPLFEGHRQPILPSEEVGFYDLKDPEVLRKQAKMAKDHGIDGFIFHHYWFDGKKVLDTPINNWLNDPTIDLPLAICWANEPWTRRWDGLDQEILIPQHYGDDWANRFWDDISEYLADGRYLKVHGRPTLIVYRANQLPNPIQTVDTWRRRATKDGHAGLNFLAVERTRHESAFSAELRAAIDGSVSFPPSNRIKIESLKDRLHVREELFGDVMSYDSAMPGACGLSDTGEKLSQGLMPGWDNSARRSEYAYLFLGSNALTWRSGVQQLVADQRPETDQAIYINAWNEWAEGAAVEPSLRTSGLLTALSDTSPARSRKGTPKGYAHRGDAVQA